MSHPEWVLKYKTKNTEVRYVKGRYYLYNITSKWCPEKKRTKKVTLSYVGSITQEGLIPKGTVKRGKKPSQKNLLPPFMDDIADLPDSRKERGKRYSLAEVFLCALLATLCGADGRQDIEHYSKANLAFLRSFFPFVHGAPSDDTLRRIFSVLDVKAFKTVFQNWVTAFALSLGSQVLEIDGKCARRPYDGKDSEMLHQVHALSASSKLVIDQEKVSDKSNEITAIPKLLEAIDVQGQIITVDALGCQEKVEQGDKKSSETRHYISSLQKDPLFTLNAIRDHWAVEAFHWVLDMSFNEDYLRTRKGNAAEAMSILRHMACNMLTAFMKGEDTSRLSLKGLRKLCGWNQETLLNVLKSHPNS